MNNIYNFALIGAAGYIAPRHLKAIKETGHQLVAVTDPNDSVGILDRYFLNVRYFPEIERFDRHLERNRHNPETKVDYVAICSPNYLHDAHVRLALRSGAVAICEKPLVINPWNLDQLAQVQEETGGQINTIMQLRLHPNVIQLKTELGAQPAGKKANVDLTYITGRGPWYHQSWKGQQARSGGLVTNIGIHFFDMLLWLFGGVQQLNIETWSPTEVKGTLALERANVNWHLSIDFKRLPFDARPGEQTTYRSIKVNGKELEFSTGFTDLHTESYRQIIAGNGFGIEDARPAIELVHQIRDKAAQ